MQQAVLQPSSAPYEEVEEDDNAPLVSPYTPIFHGETRTSDRRRRGETGAHSSDQANALSNVPPDDQDEDGAPTRLGCWGSMTKGIGRMYGAVGSFSPWHWGRQSEAAIVGSVTRSGSPIFHPGSGYEQIEAKEESVQPEDAPIVQPPAPHLTSDATEERAPPRRIDVQTTVTASPPASMDRRRRQMGPMIATRAQREALPEAVSSGDGNVAKKVAQLREEFERLASKAPIQLELDAVGSSLSLSISGPIRLSLDVPFDEEDPEPSVDYAPLDQIEELFFDAGICMKASDKPQLSTVRFSDIDFTPPTASSFSRGRRWSKGPADGSHDDVVNVADMDQDDAEWMAQRESNVRMKAIALFNNLVSESQTVQHVVIVRCAMSPSDVAQNLKVPLSGTLQSLSLKECGLSDPHLSALVRLGQRSLTNARKKETSSAPDLPEYHSLFGGLSKFEITGSFSQSSVAIFLRFLRDEQLVEVPGAHGKVTYAGTRLQELTVPSQLSSFIRSSEFAKRLPMLLVNGRGTAVPSSRFGSTYDVTEC